MWAKPIEIHIENGTIVVMDQRSKLTVKQIEKTYDIDLLESWLEEAKGPIKGAIKKQLKVMENASTSKNDNDIKDL